MAEEFYSIYDVVLNVVQFLPDRSFQFLFITYEARIHHVTAFTIRVMLSIKLLHMHCKGIYPLHGKKILVLFSIPFQFPDHFYVSVVGFC